MIRITDDIDVILFHSEQLKIPALWPGSHVVETTKRMPFSNSKNNPPNLGKFKVPPIYHSPYTPYTSLTPLPHTSQSPLPREQTTSVGLHLLK